tara:strand:+ start:5548 stop:5898 length:351 start_codon:yes stop_codon:yes gene_type:complete
MVDEKEFDEPSTNPKKNKIDGYTYKQFKQMLRDSKRSSVYNHHAMPRWGSEDFKIHSVDKWIAEIENIYEEDISIPSITVRRTWTQEQKKEFVTKLLPVEKVVADDDDDDDDEPVE